MRTGFSVHHRIVPAVKRVESVGNRRSYIVLRGRWCNITVLNMYVRSKEKSDYSKDYFHEELEHVCDHFPKYNTKILVRDFNVNLERDDIFKPTIRNESLCRDNNDNGVRNVNFATSKNLVQSTTFLRQNDP